MNLLLLATEAGGEDGGGGLEFILPAPAELLYGAISFAIVFWVLAKLAFPKIYGLLDDRSAAIQGRMEEAERELAEAERAKADYQSRIADAKGEANRIVEEAREQAESLRADIQARAEEEARQIVQRAQNDAAAERDRTLQELRAEVGIMSVELAGRIVEKELDASTHEQLVDQYIQDLSRQN